MLALSASAAGLSIVLLGLAAAILILWAHFTDSTQADDELHHRRLLEELARQPHEEQTEL